jgi:Asp-tRNA(Asn)/Glu-tRNA(Gln) amidotransferase A subunit family amidase
VVPIGLDSRGVPIAVAVVSDYLQDRTALAGARLIERVVAAIGHPDMSPWEQDAVTPAGVR